MARALELAARGRGTASPNPLVGCVVVAGDTVVGEGWHERPGEPHAEVNALAQAGELAAGATLYVNLEPCNHQGRTPPCTDALIRAGIAHVVYAVADPGAEAGGGAARLKAAGIRVSSGMLQEEAAELNQPFLTATRLGRPFVLYKTAMSLDGKIATRSGHSRWITGEAARDLVQGYRAELDAVAVGVSTVLLDDPLLTSRPAAGPARTPVKVVFDSVARTPPGARLFEPDQAGVPARVVIITTSAAPPERVARLRERGADVVAVADERGRPLPERALAALHAQGVTSILLEGGGTLAWSFLQARAVDRVAWFIAPRLLGGNGASPLGGMGIERMEEAYGLTRMKSEWIGGDLLLTGNIDYESRS